MVDSCSQCGKGYLAIKDRSNTLCERCRKAIEVNLEPLMNETLDSPDVGTMESILLEALDLFDN